VDRIDRSVSPAVPGRSWRDAVEDLSGRLAG
jgi:hypothetical protein